MVGVVTPGQEASVQYSHFSVTMIPFAETSVAHQGVASPSIVVQVFWILPPKTPFKTNGKTQLPQLLLDGGLGLEAAWAPRK